jgi:hypothetical protein
LGPSAASVAVQRGGGRRRAQGLGSGLCACCASSSSSRAGRLMARHAASHTGRGLTTRRGPRRAAPRAASPPGQGRMGTG